MKNKPIIILGATRFDSEYESTSYTLAKEFAKSGNPVYYVEYPLTIIDHLKLRNTDGHRRRKKAWQENNGIVHTEIPNLLLIVTPPLLSIHFLKEGKFYRTLLKYNEFIIAKALKKLVRQHQLEDFIYINSFVFHYPNIAKFLHPQLSIYHCVDPVITPFDIQHGIVSEKILIDNSDLVICTSNQLFREKLQIHPNTFLVPNAADIHHSIKATDPHTQIHNSLSQIEGPIVGYFGNIENRIDFDMMRTVALENKYINFVFAGPVQKHLVPDYFFEIKNIRFIGRIPYNQMPSVLKGFDVAIIPFAKTPESATVFPLKLFEYLGAGKPVVATEFNPDLKSFTGDLVTFCSNAEEFSNAILFALKNDSPDQKRKRTQLASEHTWEHRVSEIKDIIQNNLFEVTHSIKHAEQINK